AFRKKALVAKVVNRQQRLHAEKGRVARQDRLHVGRDQTSLPVMAVNHVRPEDASSYFKRGARQDGETNVIVWIVAERSPIDAVAVVQRRALQQGIGNGLANLIDARVIQGSTQPNRQGIVNAACAVQLHSSITRQQDGNLFSD